MLVPNLGTSMSRHVTEEETPLATWTLTLSGPPYQYPWYPQQMNQWLRETEENLTDLLPNGYSVRIREWDEEETPNE